MKTIVLIHGGIPERCKDEEAKKLVKTGIWRYCSRMEWKLRVRDREKLEVDAKRQADVEVRRKKENNKVPTGQDRFNKKWRSDVTA